jgi:bifunctional non-homologous end joining protein LigD
MGKKQQYLTVDGRKIPVSNLDKVLYPAGRVTKAQIIDYYLRVSSWLIPHLKDRPVTLKRYPNGVIGEYFYEKDAPGFTPEWVKTFPVPRRDSSGTDIRYILINDRPTLVWLANLANLEIHPFLHRVPRIDRPAWVVFDLDPGEGADILTCARVALILRDVLTRLEMRSFAKVSGSKGLQVYVPLNTKITYAETQPFAKAVAEMLADSHPDLIVAEMAKVLRRRKVFIDWSQNADFKTTVGVYSLRAKSRRPFVSAPVEWDELATAIDKEDVESLFFGMEDIIERLRRVGDLFKPVLTIKQTLPRQVLRYIASHTSPSLDRYARKRNFSKTRPFCSPKACGQSFALRLSSRDAWRVEILGSAERPAVRERRQALGDADGGSSAAVSGLRRDHPERSVRRRHRHGVGYRNLRASRRQLLQRLSSDTSKRPKTEGRMAPCAIQKCGAPSVVPHQDRREHATGFEEARRYIGSFRSLDARDR